MKIRGYLTVPHPNISFFGDAAKIYSCLKIRLCDSERTFQILATSSMTLTGLVELLLRKIFCTVMPWI
jgi:hypothetical protein